MSPARTTTREQTPEPVPARALHWYQVDSPDDSPFVIRAHSMGMERLYLIDRRRIKGLGGEPPPIIPVPMWPEER